MSARKIHPAKQAALDFVERNRGALATLSDSVFYFGELGMQEHRTSELMSGLLEEHGFRVERGISGFPTAFLATYGAGEPVIAIHTEYDAAPANSQRPGVAEKAEIVPGAPGHCEGHNVNAAVMVTAAIAIRREMERHGLRGTLKVFGAPAEEQLLSRPYFVRDGYFSDVGVAFHDHIYDEFKTDYGLMQAAMISAAFNFKGEAAHAAMSPWKGRDALDAAVLMDLGMAQYREHFQPGMTAHRVITDGGDQPNVIPSRTRIWWYFRHPNAEGSRALFEQAKRIAQGAALMSNCEVDVDVLAAVWPVRGNRTIAEVIQSNIEAIGMPQWTEDEQAFARSVQRKAGVRDTGLRPAATPLTGPSQQIAASNDSGDVSWAVPMARVWFPSNIPNVAYHHWTAGAALATSIAHKGGWAGAKALATSVLDFFADPSLVDEARRSFRE
jgi:aminobenzoyl-glutamate utilization protein B